MEKKTILDFKLLLKYMLSCGAANEHIGNIEQYLKREYIKNETQSVIYPKIWDQVLFYFNKYSSLPNNQQLRNVIHFNNTMPIDDLNNVLNDIDGYDITWMESSDFTFISDMLEKYITTTATYSTLLETSKKYAEIGSDFSNSKDKIANIHKDFEEISNIHFNVDFGMNFEEFVKLEMRPDDEKAAEKITFSIDELNDITDGGCERETLNIMMGRTHFGKTLWLVSEATHVIKTRLDLKVLIVTLEISATKWWQRVFWNLSGKTKKELRSMSKPEYQMMVNNLIAKYKIKERVIIKSFPTGSMSMEMLKSFNSQLIKQLKFKCDVLYVDYISIMKSQGIDKVGTYTAIGNNAVGLRGFAIEQKIAVFSVMQTNREGQKANVSDIDFGEMADSAAVSNITDLLLGGFVNDELRNQIRVAIKVLKNRYEEFNMVFLYPRVNYSLMKLWSDKKTIKTSAEKNITDIQNVISPGRTMKSISMSNFIK